ncbi:MAG: M48 family metalloprotease [Chitinispirillaceae bacterium]
MLSSNSSNRFCIQLLALVLVMVAGIGASEAVHVESLMAQSRDMELRYENQNLLLANDSLEKYLNDILGRLLQPGEKERYNLNVRILRSRSINAFATPHGTIYICTGLLARMVNEAQLAALLGHELVHVVNRHAQKNLAGMKARSRSNAQARIGLGLLLGDGISGAITGAALKSAVTGYSRDLEREADSLGLLRMVNAGYSPREFHNLFLILQEYLVTENIKEPYFFSTHPLVKERIENYNEFMANNPDVSESGLKEDSVFRCKARDVVIYDARINYAAGRPDLAGYQVDRLLAADSCDADALVLMGNIERLIAPRSTEPIRWYKKALECDPGNRAALRGIGYVYFTLGRREDAARSLSRYTDVAPGAADIKMAKDLIDKCEN